MAFTYTGPNTGPRDLIRFLTDDTVQSDQSLSDAELDFLLSKHNGDEYAAAADACEALALKYMKVSNSTRTIGPLTVGRSEARGLANQLYQRADELRGKSATYGDRIKPAMADESENIFRVGMTDNTDPSLGGVWSDYGQRPS